MSEIPANTPAPINLTLLLAILALLGSGFSSDAAEVPFASSQSLGTDSGIDAVVLGDGDGDGDLDVFTCGESSGSGRYWENTAGDGSAWTRRTTFFSFNSFADVAIGDLDGDGDLDTAGPEFFSNGVFWANNTAGDGSAWTSTGLTLAVLGSGTGFDIADIDGDGDLDMVGAGENGLRFFANNNGNATSWSSTNIVGSWSATSIVAVDMDGDGDPDVLASSSSANEVSWFENTAGDGSAWTEHAISTTRTDAESAEPGDMDGDGDLDVLFGSPTDGLFAWAENTAGNGSAWTEHTIDTGATSPVDVIAADLDLDGDLDLVAADATAFTVDWYENTAGDGSAWTKRGIESSAGEARAVAVGDVDGDGDPDVFGTDNSGEDLVWWENLTLHRSAVFPAQTPIDGSFTDVEDFDVGDIDGDGDTDVLGVATGENVSWWQNTAGDGSTWTQSNLVALADGRAVRAVDLDRDGDLDALLASNSADIAWLENTAGDGSAWTQRSIDGTLGLALGVDAADIDGDGDPDVVATDGSNDDVLWFENTAGTALAWSSVTVETDFGGARAIEAADMDGDGDQDILATAESENDVAWFENTAGDGSTWTEHTIDGSFGGGDWITAVDIDGDGDLDALGAADSLGLIRWWENTAGDGSAWTARDVDAAFSGARHVVAADLDADGDLDVLAAGTGGGAVWWENTAGDGTAWTERNIDTNFTGAIRIAVADPDGDGDLDALAATSNDDALEWWSNRGGQFALPTTDAVIDAMPDEGTTDVLLLRIDGSHRGRTGDGDLELVTFELLFEESDGDPLSDSELDALVAVLRIYHDDGDGTFETDGSDTNFHSVSAPFTLASGVLTTTFVDGEADVQVSFGTDQTYFVAIDLQAEAASASVTTLRLTHLTASSSTAEMRSTDIPLRLEFLDDTASSSITLAGGPEITVSPTSLAFGEQLVTAGATDPQTVTITNVGGEDLTIASVSLVGTDDADFAIDTDSGETTLAPAAMRTIDIVFDPSTTGAKSAALRILSNDDNEAMVDIDLGGTGTDPEITASPSSIDFGNQLVDDGPTAAQTVTITNDGNTDLILGSVSLTGTDAADFAINTDSGEASLAPMATRTVDIVFDPQSSGSKSAALRILSNDSDEATLDVDLEGTGTGVDPEITATPTSFDFGGASVTATAPVSQTFTLTNDGDAELTITSVRAVGADVGDISITDDSGEAVLLTGESRSVDVAFAPSTTGAKTATLRVLSNDADEATLEIPLDGMGTEPEIAISPLLLDFGGHAIDDGATTAQTVILTNEGDGPLVIASVVLAGTDAAEFTITGDTGQAALGSGEMRTVEIAFDPSTAGLRSATLRVVSDDLDEGVLGVALDGIGSVPDGSIFFDGFETGSVSAWSSSTDP